MQQPAMTLIFRPGVIAVLAAATIGATLLFRHLDRGYVELLDGDVEDAVRQIGERAASGDAFAGLLAGHLIAQQGGDEQENCESRRYFRLSGDGGNRLAQTMYVTNRLKWDTSGPACRWIRDSLEQLVGTSGGMAAAQLSILLRQKACGNTDGLLSLAYLRKSADLGLAASGELLERDAPLKGYRKEDIRAKADSIPVRPVTDRTWSEILAAEPRGICSFN
jgi:TPR repeat protein